MLLIEVILCVISLSGFIKVVKHSIGSKSIYFIADISIILLRLACNPVVSISTTMYLNSFSLLKLFPILAIDISFKFCNDFFLILFCDRTILCFGIELTSFSNDIAFFNKFKFLSLFSPIFSKIP